MLTARKITANTSFFLLAQVLQKLLSFIYFTILARNLGVEATGQYFFAISFATMFSVLMDLGLTPVLIRQIAKSEEGGDHWFYQIFSLKILTTLITAVILIVTDSLLFWSDEVRNLIYLTTAIVFVDSFTLLFYGYIRGKQSLKFEAWGTILFQAIVMIVGLSLLQMTDNVLLLLGVLFLASFANFLYAGSILLRRFQLKFKILYSKDLIRQIVLVTLPFALAAIFAKVYAYMDTVLLKLFLGDAEVGFYSVAYKLTFAFQFIPLAFVAAIYPAFSNYFKHDFKALKDLFIKSFNYLAFIGLPISLGIIALSDIIIHKVYTQEFSFSILPLQVLIASIPFLFVNFSLSSLLNATYRQKINTRNLGIVMIVNVVINLIFIPRLGIWGASLASSLSTLILFILNLRAVLKVVDLKWTSFKPLLGAVLSSGIMFILVLYLKDNINWLISICIGVLVYLALMFLTRAISWREVRVIKEVISKSN